MKFSIEPLKGLIDEELLIDISGLVAEEEITLRFETRDKNGTRWIASSEQRGDLDGSVRLTHCASIIWSMKPEAESHFLFKLPPQGMNLQINLIVKGRVEASEEVSRLSMGKDVKRFPVLEEGIVGTLFVPDTKKQLPAVMILTGSAGGVSEMRAELLASHGYVTLALAYFGCEGLPSELKNIPLEYFEKALEWLKKRREVDGAHMGLWGVSRGAEVSLLLGSFFPKKFQAIAAYVPSSVVFGVPGDPMGAAWIYDHQPVLPPAPLITPEEIDPERGLTQEDPILLTPYFLERMSSFEPSAIPVEKIECPLLIVGGKEDQMWPSGLFAEQIRKRLSSHSPKGTILIYEKVGHRILLPYLPAAGTVDFHPIVQRWFDFGGQPEEAALAGKEVWAKTLALFSGALHSK